MSEDLDAPSNVQPQPGFDHAGRRVRVINALASRPEGDALLLCDPRDIFYLTGVNEGISRLIVSGKATLAVTRHLFVEELESLVPGCGFLLPVPRSTVSPDLGEFVVGQLLRLGVRGVLVEPGRMSAADYLNLLEHAGRGGVSVASSQGLVQGLRARKDKLEMALIRRCVEISEAAFRELLGAGAAGLIGRSEREIANELEARMIALGADRQGFPGTGLIVASGPNCASAHHRPGERRIAAGEPVLIDWGAELNGYRSDMTRTIFPARISDFGHRVYPVVVEALHSTASRLRPGVSLCEIDRTAREAVLDAGLPEFHYGVGHGVGLEIHEEPWIRLDSTAHLLEGMVTTIEPGVYQRGVGGVRVENLYRITANGAEVLGTLPDSLDSMLVR